MLFIMEVYLRDLYYCLIIDIDDNTKSYKDDENTYPRCSAGLHKRVQEIEDLNSITLNYNEEGRLHSKYLGDRYEPAIILRYRNRSTYYYLFDGEIKDCIHPVSITTCDIGKHIEYYSSERIKQELPIGIREDAFSATETYNEYNSETLIAGYKSERVEINIADYPKQDYLLHDCMEPALQFKFAD